MAKNEIDDLAVVVSASTDQLAGDLRRAAGMIESFAKQVGRNAPDVLGGGAKASSIDFAAVKQSARSAAAAAAGEFSKSFRSIKDAIALPTKAMIAGGTGAALADPFILATAAADGLAAAVEVPFKVAAAGAHLAAAVIPLPFQLAGAAVEGLTGMVGGVVPVVGGAIAGVGKVAGSVVGGIGTVVGAAASGIGSTLGVVGTAVGQFVGGTAKVAVQGLAVSFGFLKESVNMAAEVEQTKVSFDVLIGSATKATQVLAGLRKFAAETPFSQRDVTGSGKQLLGYGVSADQLVPSIKMLGDVSAATGKPLNELVYLYGTLINQDRAYLVDIKQFATAGIPIYAELAKVLGVTKDRMREMVEDGKVGVPEVQRAFVNMTSAGGRFAGLMAKQATTFAGIREQLSDAWDVAKVRLGQAVTEELGLKDAAKDVTRFVETLHTRIDEVRPAIRFMGELGRSVGSAGWEFAKAAGQFASVNFEAIAGSFPEGFANVKKLIGDIANFKVDPRDVSRVGFDVARGVVSGLVAIVDWVDTNGKEYADSFRANFVDPVKELIGTFQKATSFAGHFADALGDMKDGVLPGLKDGRFASGLDAIGGMRDAREQARETTWFAGGGYRSKANRDAIAADPDTERMVRTFGRTVKLEASHPERYGPRRDGESADSYVGRFRDLQANIDMASELVNRGRDDFKPKLDQLLATRLQSFIAPNVTPGSSHEDVLGRLSRGEVSGPAAAPPPVPLAAKVKDRLGEAMGFIDRLQTATDAGIKGEQAAREAAVASSNALRESFFGLAGAALDATAAMGKITFDWTPGSEVMTVAKQAREEYGKDPRQKIADEYGSLKKAVAIGVINTIGDLGIGGGVGMGGLLTGLPGAIDAGTYQRATVGLAERAESITGPYRLPDAAMKDSVESVRILNQWQSGQGNRSAEALLQQILDAIKTGNKSAEKTADMLPNFAPVPQPLGVA